MSSVLSIGNRRYVLNFKTGHPATDKIRQVLRLFEVFCIFVYKPAFCISNRRKVHRIKFIVQNLLYSLVT